MKKIFSVLLFLVVICQIRAEDTNITTMRKMTQRLFPQQASFFDFRLLNDTSTDSFTIKSEGNKIIISGNNANSMAVGLNHYLKNYCLTTISWYKDDPIELPKTLPNIPAEVTIKANVPTRFFLNYCTFGYSMTWWKWSDWEHFIDWMALNGINMPLAITGQEAIWYKVWSKLGLTDEEIRGYFTGPAHLPWHRMCNLDGWQSPLPKEWLSSQAELQEQIVAREREFNMQPVLPAFAGHVPAALKRVYPNIKTSRVSEWGGFADQYRCTFLNPMDSLYAIIQKEYLTEQTRLYGTNHIYGIDPFNEIDPPSWDADSLGMMAKHIYESVAAVDPKAIWLQMTWLFYADIKHWTTPRIKSYLRSVPQDKLILLDYFCEYTEIWKQTDSYFGQPYLWCYLGNFGGNSFLSGPVKLVSERLADALKNGGSNLKGVGSTLEGIDLNQFMYEFVLDNLYFSHIDGPEVQKGKVNVELTVKKTSRAFELSFQTDGVVWVPCDRCLDDMELPISSSDKLMVKFGHEYAEEGDNLIVIPEEEGEINVAWFMYEFVALSIPMKHVHAPGKCNKAVTSKLNKHLKTNANEDSDDTFDTGGDDIVIEEEVEEQIDPRWNELKKILDNN